MPVKATSVIPPAVGKALSDKLYDKQRAATLKIEQQVRSALDADDDQIIYQIIAELTTDFATSERESSRIGGLVALGSVSTALTHVNIPQFLPQMILPIISAMSDGESKVRYFACESLYNVAKVSRGHILRWFNEIFDGLARVTADSVRIVKNGADYLDRLIKDIVAEQAATCLDWYDAEEVAGMAGQANVGEDTDAHTGLNISGIAEPAAALSVEPIAIVHAPDQPAAVDQARITSPALDADQAALRSPRLAFSLENFIPLLAERMHTYKPSTRLYLIEWIRVLDSVPGLDLIEYLPEFLDGLIRFLSDPNDDVRTKTQSVLGELLHEIRECVELQRFDGAMHAEDEMAWGDAGEQQLNTARVRSSTMQSDVHVEGRVASSYRRPHASGSFSSQHSLSQQSSRAPSVTGALPARAYVAGSSPSVCNFRAGNGGGSGLGLLIGRHRNAGSASLVSSALVHGQLNDASGELRMAARRSKIRALREESALVPGVSVAIDFAACVNILIPHLESNDQEIQGIALHWVYEFTWICPEVMIGFVPTLINALLPSVSHPVSVLRHTAEDASRRLYDLVSEAPAPARERRARRRQPECEPKTEPAGIVKESGDHLPRLARPLPPVTSTVAAVNNVTRPKSPAASMTSVGSVPGHAATRSRAESLLHASTVSPVVSMAPSRVTTPGPQGVDKRLAQSPPPAVPVGGGAGRDRRESVSTPLSPLEPVQPAQSNPVVASETAGSPATVAAEQNATRAAQTPRGGNGGTGMDMPEEYEEVVVEPFNYEYAATAIMELFAKNVHEQTKVAGMRWLLLLHRKAPWRILTPDDMSFPVLLKMLSDSSEQVIKLDLELFAQISQYSQTSDAAELGQPANGINVDPQAMPYLSRFLGSLLQMFATSRVLLETRAALMVRQLCVVLDPELVFCLLAKLLAMPRFGVMSASSWDPSRGLVNRESVEMQAGENESVDSSSDSSSDGEESVLEQGEEVEGEEVEGDGASHLEQASLADLEFVSVMVQHLSWILVTAPETEGLRLLLRQYNPSMPLTMPALASLEKTAGAHPGVMDQGETAGQADLSSRQPSQAASRRRGTSQSSLDAPLQKPAKLTRNVTSRGRSIGGSRTGSAGALRGDRRRPGPQQRRRMMEAEQAKNVVTAAVQRVQHDVQVNQRSHRLFTALFRTWSHNPAACLTLCLLSQHYETATELIGIFGQQAQDLTVSFLVQLDKLVQLIESPVFSYLRLQLLDGMQYPHLLRALYGLLMLLPQSSAFAILRNRLSSVAMLPFPGQLMPARPMGGFGVRPGDESEQQRTLEPHFHYHYHSYYAGQTRPADHAAVQQPLDAASAAPAGDASQAAGGRARSLLSNVVGISAQDLAELMRLLSVSSQQAANDAGAALPPSDLGSTLEKSHAMESAGRSASLENSSVILQQLAALRASEAATQPAIASPGSNADSSSMQTWAGGNAPGNWSSAGGAAVQPADYWMQSVKPGGSDLSKPEIERLLEGYKAVRRRHSRVAAGQKSR